MTESMVTQLSEQKRHIRFIIYLLILGTFVIFFRLGDRDMWNGLESESAVAAWDMVETGRILIPRILDQPFIDNRPPGAWWLIAATYKLTGVRNTWTARRPSALACVFLVYAMGRRAANADAGFVSALILMGMLYFVLLGRMSQQDMLLALATALCLWAFWRSLDNNASVFRFVMAFQVFLGFGVLMKGPAVAINIFSSLAFFMGDIYQRAGNASISQAFAEKVALAVPDNARLGTLDDHAALLFHLGRPVEYVELSNANHFLQNSNHYLIVGKDSKLQQIDEKFRRVIFSYNPYRHRRTAYLLQGGQLSRNSRPK